MASGYGLHCLHSLQKFLRYIVIIKNNRNLAFGNRLVQRVWVEEDWMSAIGLYKGNNVWKEILTSFSEGRQNHSVACLKVLPFH